MRPLLVLVFAIVFASVLVLPGCPPSEPRFPNIGQDAGRDENGDAGP